MDRNEKKLYTVRYLVCKSLEGQVTEKEMERLDHLVVEDPEARRYYVEFLQVHITLRKLFQKDPVSTPAEQDGIWDVALWDELARHEKTAESVIPEHDQPQPEILFQTEKRRAPQKERKLSRFSIFSIAASVAAVLLVALYILLVPVPQPIVATLTDAIHAQWADSRQPPQIGEDVRAESRRLLSGVISLKFESGAEVVIEGPAEYFPLSVNKMSLTRGKAFARVSSTAIGFTIDTPQSSVVDLGTEFGVAVDPADGSEIYVYRGKVNLVAGLASQPKKSEILRQTEARKVDADRGVISSAMFKEYFFVQAISSKDNCILYGPPVSLSSFVAGGDGLTPGDQPAGIDPATGQIHQTMEQGSGRVGSGGYSAVPDRPFIDGVFVPNGPCVVSSAGHTFEAFPATAGSFWSDITTSPIFNHIATSEAGEVLYRQQLVATLGTREENDFPKIPVTMMHANSGITFNLNKIREAYKGAEIVEFRAACGVSKNVLAKMRNEYWVLLDGQNVYHYVQSGEELKAQEIKVPVRPDQSFLTLATTDGGDGTSFDWCVFENPILELEPKASK